MNNHTASDFTVSPEVHNKMLGVSLWRHIQQNLRGFSIDFKTKEKIGEAIINAPAVQRASKSSVIGWEAWEYVAISLTNTTKCRSCDRLIHFNGVRPQFCPSCKGAP